MRCFGGGHGSAGALGFNLSETDFTWAAGGGIDLDMSHHFGIRMAQVDFLQTRSNGSSQNNLRISVGVPPQVFVCGLKLRRAKIVHRTMQEARFGSRLARKRQMQWAKTKMEHDAEKTSAGQFFGSELS